MSLDVSDFVKPILEAATITETSGERIVKVIHEQTASWSAMTTAVVPAVATVTAAGLGYASTMAVVAQQNAILSSVNSSWAAAGQFVYRYGGIVSKVVGTVVPQWRIGAAIIGTGLLAYKAANTETAESVVKSSIEAFTKNEKLADSYGKLKDATSGLREALSTPFEGAAATASQFVQMLNPIPSIAAAIAPAISTTMDAATSAIQTTTEGVTQLTDGITALALAANDRNLFKAGKYYEEAAALRELAKETERVIALQEQQKAIYSSYGEIQQSAILAAERAEALQAVAMAKTEGEINALRTSYQELFRETTAGFQDGDTWSKDELAHIASITNAIERQAAAIKAGRVHETEADVKGTSFGDDSEKSDSKSKALTTYEQMAEQLNKLNFGQNQAARMAIAASDATDDEVAALMALHDQIVQVTEAQKKQKIADDLHTNAVKQAQDLRDQIDELAGTYSKAEIAKRKMLRAGNTEQDATEVAALQAELDKLREKDPKKQKTELSAALRGSKEANSVTMRGVGGADPKIKLQADANKLLKSIAQNTAPAKTAKSIKLLPANIRA